MIGEKSGPDLCRGLTVLCAALAVVCVPIGLFAKDFTPRQYGAKGDGVTLDTAAIQSAIDAAAAAGGGRVVFDDGTFLSGTITLKSGVELHLDVTGTLLGSSDCADYPERTNLRHIISANLPRERNACLIWAEEAHDIAITGRGTIDCNGRHFVRPVRADEKFWTPFKRKEGLLSPPRVVFFAGCSDVLVTDVKMVNQPAGWSYWIHDCDRVVFDRVRILADMRLPNNDGIHVNCSRDVSVSNCRIECCDDSIVVRANSRSLRENRTCERVTVSNCSLRSNASCIRIGYVNDGVIRNCVFSNIVMHDSRFGVRIELPRFDERKSDRGRESTLIENMTFSNVAMERMMCPITCTISENPRTLCEAVRNIRFTDIHCRSGKGPVFRGRKNCPFEKFVFTACSFESETPVVMEGCRDFRSDNRTFLSE